MLMDFYWFLLSVVFFLGSLNFVFISIKSPSERGKYQLLANLCLILGLVSLYIYIIAS